MRGGIAGKRVFQEGEGVGIVGFAYWTSKLNVSVLPVCDVYRPTVYT